MDMNQPTPSYYLSCGKSLWERKQEEAEDEAVMPADLSHVLEQSIKPQLNLSLVSS